MITKLLSQGKKERKWTFIQGLFEWLPNLIMCFLLYSGLVLIFEQRLVKGLLITTILIIFLELAYLLFWKSKTVNRWSYQAKKEIKEAYLKQIFYSEETNLSQVLQNDLKGLERLDVFYQVFFPACIKFVIGYSGLLIYDIWFKSSLFIYPLIALLFISGLMKIQSKRGDQTNKRHLESFKTLGKRFLDDLSGMNTLIMYQVDEKYQQDFEQESEFYRKKTMEVLFYQLQSLFILNAILYLMLVIGVFSTYFQWQNGTISMALAISISIYFMRFMMSGKEIGYFFHIVKSSKPALTSIYRVINQKVETKKYIFNETLTTPIQSLMVKEVNFDYSDKRTILNKVSFKLHVGKLYGLTGENGSGKSTLAKILMGEQISRNGKIYMNDKLVTDENIGQLQQSIGYLGSNAYLFQGTIEENLCFGTTSPDWQSILENYQLCQFVKSLPLGFQTQVGENGRLLSPGQRQQIAFARLVLADKEVYIFDEVTSNIDASNSQQILQAMKQLSRKKIVLVITHNWIDIQQMDQVLFLDEHNLEVSTHSKLFDTDKNYRKLVEANRLQLQGGEGNK